MIFSPINLLAIVQEIKTKTPRYGQRSATAQVKVFGERIGETIVEIPVLEIVDQLEFEARYHLKIEITKIEDQQSIPESSKKEPVIAVKELLHIIQSLKKAAQKKKSEAIKQENCTGVALYGGKNNALKELEHIIKARPLCNVKGDAPGAIEQP